MQKVLHQSSLLTHHSSQQNATAAPEIESREALLFLPSLQSHTQQIIYYNNSNIIKAHFRDDDSRRRRWCGRICIRNIMKGRLIFRQRSSEQFQCGWVGRWVGNVKKRLHHIVSAACAGGAIIEAY